MTIPWRTIRKIKFADRKKAMTVSAQLKDIKHVTMTVNLDKEETGMKLKTLFLEHAFPATPTENPCFDFFQEYKINFGFAFLRFRLLTTQQR